MSFYRDVQRDAKRERKYSKVIVFSMFAFHHIMNVEKIRSD